MVDSGAVLDGFPRWQLTERPSAMFHLQLGAIENGRGIYTHRQAAPADAAPVPRNPPPLRVPLRVPLPVPPRLAPPATAAPTRPNARAPTKASTRPNARAPTKASTRPKARLHNQRWTDQEFYSIKYLLALEMTPHHIALTLIAQGSGRSEGIMYRRVNNIKADRKAR